MKDTLKPETPDQPQAESGSRAPICSTLAGKLNSLSTDAKEWLEKTCDRFADGQSYDKRPVEIAECENAGLIRKRRYYIDIEGDVMDAVHSNNFFKQNVQDDSHA